MADENSSIGKQIGNYRIVAALGSGGFADVYQGQHLIFTNDPPIAIKLLYARLNTKEREQFIQEAQLLRKLHHPHILSVLDAGFHESVPYIVIEYAAQGSLQDRLDRQPGKPLPIDEALTILTQIGEALHYAHLQNIVHRDLKPDNILFNAKGEALLADFGLAAILSSARTMHIGSAGTPAYMAPEMFEGRVSVKSDQYTLGCIAYELLTGRKPFDLEGVPIYAAQYQHAKVEPGAPSQHNRQISPHIERAILTAMAKDRTHRHADVHTFLTALQPPQTLRPPEPPQIALQPPQKSAQEWLKEGNAFFDLKRNAEALAAYDTSIPPVLPMVRGTLPVVGGPPRGTTLLTHESSGPALAWSPDGQHIASGSEQIEIWNATTGRTLTQLDTYGAIDFVEWSPDRKYIIASEKVLQSPGGGWDTHPHYIHMVECLEVSEQSRRTFWFHKRKPDFSSLQHSEQQELEKRSLLSGEYLQPILLLWSPNGSKVAVSIQHPYYLGPEQFIVSSLRDRKPIVQRSLISSANDNTVVWSPDSTRIAWGIKNEIPVCDVSSSQQEGFHLLTYRGHCSPIVAVSWSPDGRITSRSEDGSVQVWEAATGQELSTFTAPVEKRREPLPWGTVIEKSAISPDGTLRAIATDNGIEIRTVAHGETVFMYRGHFSDKTAQSWSPEVKALAWSPDGTRIAFARFDGKIYVWQAA